MRLIASEAQKIVALRNEKGSYNFCHICNINRLIVALRNEKGSYNDGRFRRYVIVIVALRNEKGSYNSFWLLFSK